MILKQENFCLHNKVRPSLLILAFTALFAGCSWQEYFVIVNETNFPVTVQYNLSETANGFGFFDSEPSAYPFNPTGDIDWSNKLNIKDIDSSKTGISVTLPSKSTLLIGSLMNEHYESHNQKDVNDRVNLKNISIIHPERAFEITGENFENYFRKRNGNIEFRINSLALQ